MDLLHLRKYTDKEFGERLKWQRESLRLDTFIAANECNLSEEEYIEYEAGKHSIYTEKLIVALHICEFLGIYIDDLFSKY